MLVCHDPAWREAMILEQRAHELSRGFRIAPALDEEVEDLTFIVHGAPKPIALPPDNDDHLIEVPMIVGFGTGLAQVCGDDGSKLQEPAADSLIGNVQAPLGEHLLHIAVTQSEAGIQPNRMANDIGWEAVTLEGELAHRPSLKSGAHPCHLSLCDNAVELARACQKLGHKAVESRYNFHGFREFWGDDT